MRLKLLMKMATAEIAAVDWWDSLSDREQSAYLQAYPKSKHVKAPCRSAQRLHLSFEDAALVKIGTKSDSRNVIHEFKPDAISGVFSLRLLHAEAKRNGFDDPKQGKANSFVYTHPKTRQQIEVSRTDETRVLHYVPRI